jgi:hypothetical protein
LEALARLPPRGGAHKTFKAALTIEMDERDFGACYWRMWACLPPVVAVAAVAVAAVVAVSYGLAQSASNKELVGVAH